MPTQLQQFATGVPLPRSIYLDANILIAFIDSDHQLNLPAVALIGEAVRSRTPMYVSALTIDEVWHHIAGIWAKKESIAQRATPAVMHRYSARLIAKTEDLLTLGVQPVSQPDATCRETLQLAMEVLRINSLMARDVMHTANALRSNVEGIVTNDRRFDALISPAGYDVTIVKL